ncbi:EpsG family protein [Dysgonomonas sp.]|uniref:EpsG family protein n=1 Tax=Dysgonomonas sp. TaxID=1891233 RepID=UPI0028AD8045|nr:EpsG family protein [Dysgonomonas sp.]
MGSVGNYIFLETLLLFIFIFCGFGISKGRKDQFWIYSSIVIISYSLIKGLRYGRGPDYLWYKLQYENMDLAEKKELGFRFVNEILSALDIPYYGAFILYSFVLIVAVMMLLKNYREIAMYALPIFFIVTGSYWATAAIRQYLAMAFILIAFLYLMKDHIWKCLGFMLIGILIHTASFIFLPFFLLFYYIKIPIKSPKDVKFSGYLNNAEFWFTDAGSDGNIASITLLFRRLLSNVILIYFGVKYLNRIQNFRLPFFLFYLSIIILKVSGDIELPMRIGLGFNTFEMFVAGVVLSETKKTDIYTFCAMFFLIINYGYNWIAPLLSATPETSMFIWDIIH